MKLASDHPRLLAGALGPWKMANPVRAYDWGSTAAVAVPAEGAGRSRALSIQVHPSPAQAAAGYAGERAAGVPQAERRYTDRYAKPEMLLPVTEFAALAGLHPRDQVVQMLAGLVIPALRPVLLALKAEPGQPGPAGPDGALTILAGWPRARRGALARLICECAHGLLAPTATSLDPDQQSSLEWVITLAEQHPDDLLVVAPLLLRLHRLQPGQPIYVPPGVPHAYLSGRRGGDHGLFQ